MKNNKKFISIVLAFAMVFTSMSFAFADETVNEDVSTPETSSTAPITLNDVVLSGSVNNLKADFSWSAAMGPVAGYAIRIWTGSTSFDDPSATIIVDTAEREDAVNSAAPAEGSIIDTQSLQPLKNLIQDTYYSYTGFKNGTTYYFQVGVSSDGVNLAYSDAKSFGVNYSIVKMKAGPTVSFRRSSGKTYGERTQYDNYVVVKFTKPSTTVYDNYVLYRGTKKLLSLNKYSSKVTNKNVPGGTYVYSIRAYFKGTDIYAEFKSSSIKVHSLITAAVKGNITWTAVTKETAKLYKTSTGSSYYTYIPNGTKMSTTGKQYPSKMEFVYSKPKRIQVKFDGQTGWVKWSSINIKYAINNKSDYSVSKKEEFINSKNISSSSKYLIWVSRYTQRVNIFKGKKGSWKLYKVFNTNTGKFQRKSIGGYFKLKSHTPIVYRISEDGRPYYFKNSTSFGGRGTFHNITRWCSNNKRSASIKRVPITGGCVRLFDNAAKFIYSSVPLKTKVYVH